MVVAARSVLVADVPPSPSPAAAPHELGASRETVAKVKAAAALGPLQRW